MSESLQPDTPRPVGGDTEEVDAVAVVVASPRAFPVRWDPRAAVPAVQAAAVAATSFVAGAAVVGLAHRRHRRRELARSRRTLRRGAGELVQIVGSRSLLVDVHLLGERK